MRKYLFIYKATLMENLQYIMNILLSFTTYLLIVYIFINLWQYLYSDPKQLISGYSMSQMLWYIIITELLWFGTRNQTLTSQMSTDIKSGSIAYGMNKPYHYLFFVISKYLGEITIKFSLFLGAGIIIGLVFVGSVPRLGPLELPIVLLSFLLGILINAAISMSISSLSFWMEDATPLQWIYDKLIIVVGTLFPVEVFPLWLQPLIKGSPIYVINYGPAKLVIDYSNHTAGKVFFAQVTYLTVTTLLLFIIFRKGVKQLNVNGG